jgi:nucleotide-binding universal stress UspA family protein
LAFKIKHNKMKKIIAAFDGLKYSESTCEHSVNIAKLTGAHLVGIFLDDPHYTSYKIYDLLIKDGVSEVQFKKYEEKDKATREAAAQKFERACGKAGVEFSVHHDKSTAIAELKHESIYADLLVIDSSETLTHYAEKSPTRFIRDLLGDTQCPVLVVPKKYKPINKIVLLYDGKPTSVYAVKMFSYLLARFKEFEIETIAVNALDESLHLHDNKLMREFMKRHFPAAKYTIRNGWAEVEIIKYLKELKESPLVVLGAYHRGSVSRWFKESMADTLMKNVKLPLFIAHNK